MVGLDHIWWENQRSRWDSLRFPSPDGELVGLDLEERLSFPLGGIFPILLFPSPDGELVGLDECEDWDLVSQIEAYKAEKFPSPDGELVGLDRMYYEGSRTVTLVRVSVP
ncbi:protein of unknown function [Limnospira indica PCC 8005]|uniref:Uncharacterized protein n=1 Tax=Limnospira indica PCC 8005 TaxID=376219 RepID=A0A9P1KIC7_9CYAN|nr:protein of unknown function [Limnospira indica PCC 8005]